jgi:cobalt-zinc-cadmium efflux system outer membrane protein
MDPCPLKTPDKPMMAMGWLAALGPALLVLALLGSGTACPAEDAAPAPLTLADAQRLAVQRNLDFRIAGIQVDAALAQLKVAREFPNPTLGLSTAKISTDGVPEETSLGNGLLDRSYDSIVSLNQLFLIGKRGLMRDAATAGVHSAEYQLEDARRLLLQAVTQAYAAALAANKQADVLTESAAMLRKEADIAATRFKAGDLSSSDKAQIEIAADQDELGAEAQRATARTAVVTLEILLGKASPEGTTPLADTLDAWVGAIPGDLDRAPVGSRPDIAAAESSLAQAEANVTLERRQRVPDITASVQYERNPAAQPDTVGVGLSLPLPLWDHFTGEILAAQAARNQSEAQLEKVRIQASADVAAARVAFREAFGRFRRYSGSIAPKSSEVARSVSYAFEKGGASLVDLLEAERNDNQIRLARVQSQADTASTAVALQAALGRLQSAENP